MAQLSGLTSMTNAGTAANLARLAGQTNIAQNTDQYNLNMLQQQQQLAQSTSADALARLNSQFAAAQSAQAAAQTRENNMFGQQFSIDQLNAMLYGGFYGQGGQLSGAAGQAGINAQANAAGLTGQGQNASAQQTMDFWKLGLSGLL